MNPGDRAQRRIAIVASASGNGKTTLGRRVAAELGLPFVELDALVHQTGWNETPDDALRRIVGSIVVRESWVIDGCYERKLGPLVLAAADEVVWLDLSARIWLPRLVRRTWRRACRREQLWNGNREELRHVLWGRDSLFLHAIRSHRRRRRSWPTTLETYPVSRLRTPDEVESWVAATVGSVRGKAV